ncbi:MAG: TOBE domain-containing protein, partial [Roseburia sp.]
MKISDMLGQYNRNVRNGTEELQSVRGMQKMVSSVAELEVGNIFEGTVNSIRGGKVLLALGNGQMLTAQMDGKVSIQPGTAMFFQVKSNDGETVAIRPYNAGNAGNPILLDALTTAGIPATDRTFVMVDAMMQEQMSVGKQSLLDMVRILNAN